MGLKRKTFLLTTHRALCHHSTKKRRQVFRLKVVQKYTIYTEKLIHFKRSSLETDPQMLIYSLLVNSNISMFTQNHSIHKYCAQNIDFVKITEIGEVLFCEAELVNKLDHFIQSFSLLVCSGPICSCVC